MATAIRKRMIYPSVEELSKGGYNRYVLCIAAAKCARKITDESYTAALAEMRDEKPITKRANGDEKPVNTAIKQMHRHCFDIVLPKEEEQSIN